MATIKSYSDLQQSKKLAEILPLESADMHYPDYYFDGNAKGPCNTPYKEVIEDLFHVYINPKTKRLLPCWSLAALFSVLPFHLIINNQRYAFSMHKGLNKNGETYMIRYNIFNTDVCLYSTDYYNNPVDACFDIVEKLKELGWL